MKMMEPIFKCVECGETVRWPSTYASGSTVALTMPACQNCAKLTYGPISEVMLSEALREAGSTGNWKQAATYHPAQARFVLRLLNSLNAVGSDSYCRLTNTDGSARDELLRLAREK